jgi:Fe-S-cluster containining protein
MIYTNDEFGKNETIINYNNPNCDNCNDCCSMMANITQSEYDSIMAEINSNKELERYVMDRIRNYKHKLFNDSILNWMCIFSDKDKKCKIYDIRPSICRDFHCSDNNKIDKTKYVKNFIMIYNLFEDLVNTYFGNDSDYQQMIMQYKFSFQTYVYNLKETIDKEG